MQPLRLPRAHPRTDQHMAGLNLLLVVLMTKGGVYEPGSLGNGLTPGGSFCFPDVKSRARPSNRSRDTAQTNLDWDTSVNSSGVKPEFSRNVEAFPNPDG